MEVNKKKSRIRDRKKTLLLQINERKKQSHIGDFLQKKLETRCDKWEKNKYKMPFLTPKNLPFPHVVRYERQPTEII